MQTLIHMLFEFHFRLRIAKIQKWLQLHILKIVFFSIVTFDLLLWQKKVQKAA
jgi:hypothetical protein